jgi:hypothetical protein
MMIAPYRHLDESPTRRPDDGEHKPKRQEEKRRRKEGKRRASEANARETLTLMKHRMEGERGKR